MRRAFTAIWSSPISGCCYAELNTERQIIMIEIRRLKQLAAFAEHGTLGAASEILHFSQPTLTGSVKQLEDELGVTWNGRSADQPPTKAGETKVRGRGEQPGASKSKPAGLRFVLRFCCGCVIILLLRPGQKEACPLKTEYPALRYLWRITALDLVMLIMEWIIPFADALATCGTLLPQEKQSAAAVYLLWTLRCLRLAHWSVTVVLLVSLRGRFRGASVWYLLRIALFLLSYATVGVEQKLEYYISLMMDTGFLSLPRILIFFFNLAVTPLLLPLGSRSILRAEAEQLDFYGISPASRTNRRCAAGLAVCSGLYEGTLLVYTLLLTAFRTAVEREGHSLLSGQDTAATMRGMLSASALLTVFGGLGLLSFWMYSAWCMRQTGLLLEGLRE